MLKHPTILQANINAPGLPPGRYRLGIAGGRIRNLDPLGPWGVSPGPASGTVDESGLAPELILDDDEFLVPGFVDAHTHMLGVGTARLKPDLRDARSLDEVWQRLETWLRAHPGPGPVIAEGWDQSLWSDPRLPTRAEIDHLTARPLALRRVCGHIAVLNSAALRAVGDGWEQVDADSGLALESLPLRLNRIWPWSPEQLSEALEYAQEVAIAHGVTGVQEMGDGTSFRAFGRLDATNRLRIHVSHFFQSDGLQSVVDTGLVSGGGGDHLRVAGIKIFLDGSLGGRTAALRDPYPASAGGGRGTLLFTDDELARKLQICADADLPVAMHAIGDRAIAQAVGVVESLLARSVLPAEPGPRLEHAEMLPAELLERALAAGCRLSMQPNFTSRWQGAGGLYEQTLGPARARALNPYGDAFRSGSLLFGSDTMPLGPLLGLRGACDHPDPEQRLHFREGIQAYTAGSSAGVRRPFRGGYLEVGEPADLVALRAGPGSGTHGRSIDLGAMDPNPKGELARQFLESLTVSGTWIGGECVYRDHQDSGA